MAGNLWKYKKMLTRYLKSRAGALRDLLARRHMEIRLTPPFRRRFIADAFNSGHPRRALFCGLIDPFLRGIQRSHTAYLENYTAAELLHELGYRVDVIDYSLCACNLDFSVYEVIYGSGYATIESLSAANSFGQKRFWYSPGCSGNFCRDATIRRMLDFARRSGVIAVESMRYPQFPDVLPVALCNALIVLGNDFVRRSYDGYSRMGGIYTLCPLIYDTATVDVDVKDFAGRRHFLWFGSTGLVHKGLDLVIEFFRNRPELTLHIAGAHGIERSFHAYYARELGNQVPNIINHGFLKIDSPEFLKVVRTCQAAIFPSCSEGGSPALLTVVAAGGLIPIFTESCGVDFPEGAYHRIADLTPSAVGEAVDEFLRVPPEQVQLRARELQAFVRERHCYGSYRRNLKGIIQTVLAKPEKAADAGKLERGED